MVGFFSSAPAVFSPHKIGIIVGRDCVGDALIKLPFLRALRAAWPEAEIHWITSQGPTAYATTLRGFTRPLLTAIHETPRWLATKAKPQRREAPAFDLLIDTRGKLAEAIRVKRSIPATLFIAPAFRYLVSDKRPPLFSKRPAHLVDRLMQMVELAAGSLPKIEGRLPVPDLLYSKARQILPKGQRAVGFAPGAGNARKVWPLDRFIRLAHHCERKGCLPVFLLGPDELPLFDPLMEAVPTAIFPLQAQNLWGADAASVLPTLAIGSLLDLAIANDSGTSHMLAAVDCPLISLFGPTSPAKLAPKVTRGVVLRAQDFGGEDMAAIPTESVAEAIDRIIL